MNITSILFNDEQYGSVVRAKLLLSERLNRTVSVSDTIDLLCSDFVARHTPPEDMTNIVPFERDAKQRQPNR